MGWFKKVVEREVGDAALKSKLAEAPHYDPNTTITSTSSFRNET